MENIPERITPEFYKEMLSVKFVGTSAQKALIDFRAGYLRVIVDSHWNVYLGINFHGDIMKRQGLSVDEIAVTGYVKSVRGKAHLRVAVGDWDLEKIGLANASENDAKTEMFVQALEAKISEQFEGVTDGK